MDSLYCKLRPGHEGDSLSERDTRLLPEQGLGKCLKELRQERSDVMYICCTVKVGKYRDLGAQVQLTFYLHVKSLSLAMIFSIIIRGQSRKIRAGVHCGSDWSGLVFVGANLFATWSLFQVCGFWLPDSMQHL